VERGFEFVLWDFRNRTGFPIVRAGCPSPKNAGSLKTDLVACGVSQPGWMAFTNGTSPMF